MIKLEIDMDDLNYENLVDRYLPMVAEELRGSGNPGAMLFSDGLPACMAKKIIGGLPQDKKDALAADLLNAYSKELRDTAAAYAAQNGVDITILNIHASAK